MFVCVGEQVAAVAAATKQLLPSLDVDTTSAKDVRNAVRQQTGLPESKALKLLVNSLVDGYLTTLRGEMLYIWGVGGEGGHVPTICEVAVALLVMVAAADAAISCAHTTMW